LLPLLQTPQELLWQLAILSNAVYAEKLLYPAASIGWLLAKTAA
jgi:hypothetical protein